MVGAELELSLGEDHPARELAAELGLAERLLRPGQSGAWQRDRDGRARAEVPGAAHDLPRLGLPDVDSAELEPVGIRMLAGLDDPADEEERVVAVLVHGPARLDGVHLGRTDAEAVHELRDGHVERDVVAQPGERELHLGLRHLELPQDAEVVLPERPYAGYGMT